MPKWQPQADQPLPWGNTLIKGSQHQSGHP
ncbi:unnamed protein product, partial [Rhizoctonia solani]